MYVEENVFVPLLTQVRVPVRLAWTNYEKGANATEWMLDTKQLYQGVVVARSLLPEVGTKTFVRQSICPTSHVLCWWDVHG